MALLYSRAPTSPNVSTQPAAVGHPGWNLPVLSMIDLELLFPYSPPTNDPEVASPPSKKPCD